MSTRIEVKTATVWALLLALLILVFILPKPAAKPAQKPVQKPLFREKHRPMRAQEELDQEVYAAARKPIDDYYKRHPEETPIWKDVENHANQ